MNEPIPFNPLLEGIKAGLEKGDLSTFFAAAENKDYSAKLLTVISKNLNDFEEKKEKIAPLMERMIVNLPPSERDAPEVKILLNFLKKTTHFNDTHVRENLLIDAAKVGNNTMINELFQQKVDTDVLTTIGKTTLHWVATNWLMRITQLLLGAKTLRETFMKTTLPSARASREIHVNAVDSRQLTALHWACIKGNVQVIPLLIEKGADINAKDDRGFTPLHWACLEGNKEVSELLLKLGADINAQDIEGITPLHLTCEQGREEIAQVLVNAGALVNAVDEEQLTPLHLAIRSKNEKIVELLTTQRSIIIDVKDVNGSTPLHLASISGSNEIIRMVLAAGAEVNAKDSTGMTPLHWASVQGDEEAVKLLLQQGADIHVTDEEGMTPLQDVVIKNNLSMARLLLDRGIEVDQPNLLGWTPLYAMLVEELNGKDRSDMIDLLMQSGADKNLADEILERIILAHVMGDAGDSLIIREGFPPHKIKLDGLPKQVSMHKLKGFFSEYIKLPNNQLQKLPKGSLDKVVKAIETPFVSEIFDETDLPESVEKNVEKIISNLKLGQPVVILGGHLNHAINIVLVQGPNPGEVTITICNRGEGAELANPIEAKAGVSFVVPKDKVNSALIRSFLKDYSDIEGFQEMVTNNLGPIKLRELGFTQKKQDVENCTWASSKTVLLALLVDLCGDETIAREIYKSFTLFAREQILKRYINRNNPYADQKIIAKSKLKLEKKRQVHQRNQEFCLSDLKHSIQTGTIDSLIKETENKHFSIKLSTIIFENMDELSAEKEKLAPLIANVILKLPSSMKDSSKVQDLLDFLKTTNYFREQIQNRFIGAAKNYNNKAMEDLLKLGVPVDYAQETDGRTALHWVCATGNLKMAVFLLASGTSINAKDNLDRTALHLACGAGNAKIVELLLNHHSIRINDVDQDGYTPLRRALLEDQKHHSDNSRKIVELLTKRGAS